MEYHLRLSIHKTNALTVLNAFCASFKPADIVSAYETKGIKEDGTIINPHTHAYIKYETVPSKQSISSFFKKWKHLLVKPTNETAGYSHKLQKKTKEENIVYTIKGGDIIINTIGDTINEYKIKTELINENKTYQNMLAGRTIGDQEDRIKAEANIKQLEENLIKSGLSKTFASDIIKLIFSNLK